MSDALFLIVRVDPSRSAYRRKTGTFNLEVPKKPKPDVTIRVGDKVSGGVWTCARSGGDSGAKLDATHGLGREVCPPDQVLLPVRQSRLTANYCAHAQDMVRLATGQMNPQAAFLKGKIKVKGNVMLGLRCQSLLMKEVSKMSRL